MVTKAKSPAAKNAKTVKAKEKPIKAKMPKGKK